MTEYCMVCEYATVPATHEIKAKFGFVDDVGTDVVIRTCDEHYEMFRPLGGYSIKEQS
jgi:hypothetical protein